MSEPLHSEQFLNDTRDDWWNADYLALVARRCALGGVRRALDVGCGKGHWTRLVRRLLPADAELFGVDREPVWIEEARRRGGATFSVATGDTLPFPDASFDLVTCQTLLIHVPDVPAVLAEMRRVLRPGGRLLAAEPNNLVNAMASTLCIPGATLDDVLASVRFTGTVELGKRALGQGDNGVGERLVGLLGAGWSDVAVWIDDRTRCMRPPYPAAVVAEDRRELEEGRVGWTHVEARLWYLAGGGTPDAFDADWASVRRLLRLRVEAIDAGTYAAAEGGLHYLTTALRD